MNASEDKILNLNCVKTNKGCFISDASTNYYKENLKVLLFNGKNPSDTYCKDWYYVEEYPTSVQQEVNGGIINARYELKDESLASDKMPKVIPYEEECNYNWEVISGLYSYEYNTAPPYLKDINFDIQVICEVDDYNFPPRMEYSAIKREAWSDRQYTITNTNVQHQLLDKMIFPAVLLHERPCKFSSKQMYDMTRQYILEHIDNAHAKVTSNYDFCFEVRKLIPLLKPETITYHNIFARTKKERNKLHTTVKSYEEKTIFEMTHDQSKYNNYSVIPEMCANNEAELKEKVDTWLESLLEIINKPLCTCPHCNGTGYLEDITKEGFSYSTKED